VNAALRAASRPITAAAPPFRPRARSRRGAVWTRPFGPLPGR